MPVSNGIPESEVNPVVTCRMAKKREMRCNHRGGYCMAQVRASVLTGKFSSHRILALKITDSRYGTCIGPTDRTDGSAMPCAKLGS
jgi:phosphoheptose isomerase